MIFVTDAAGKAIYLGGEWTALTGQTLAEAVDYGWARVVHPADRELVRDIVAEAIRQQRPFSVRYRVLTVDGRSAWLLGGAVPSFGPPGRSFLGEIKSGIIGIIATHVRNGHVVDTLTSYALRIDDLKIIGDGNAGHLHIVGALTILTDGFRIFIHRFSPRLSRLKRQTGLTDALRLLQAFKGKRIHI